MYKNNVVVFLGLYCEMYEICSFMLMLKNLRRLEKQSLYFHLIIVPGLATVL